MKNIALVLALLLLGTAACHRKTAPQAGGTAPKAAATPPQAAAPQAGVKGVYEFAFDGAAGRVYTKTGVFARQGMVASAHPAASAVGAEVLRQGGNVVDAAVATFFALAVVHPSAGNIGGGGFLLFRDKDGRHLALDFREKAPAAATRDMYLDSLGNPVPGLSWAGLSASGVPGSVDGMVAAHHKLGRLPWARLLAPAIGLARGGVVLTENEAQGLNRIRTDLRRFNPGSRLFLPADTARNWAAGELFTQPELARTLERIAAQGRSGFYGGETARLLTQRLRAAKAPITQADLDGYRSVWRTPVTGTYRGCTVVSMPPPSSGGIALLQLLRLVEPYPLARFGHNQDSTVQVMIEAERRVYADRARWLGDPDFFRVPQPQLLSDAFLKQRWQHFSWAKATPSREVAAGAIAGYESPQTTHLSVADAEGNAVALTTTLNNSYGSRVVVEGAGFLMNDEMDDFSVKPGVPNAFGLIGAEANAIAPGKRMLSSMTPTIVEKDGRLLLVLGTPGGSTIITAVFQTLLNVVDFGMGMQQAVNALKFHHQWLPDNTTYEVGALPPTTLERLRAKGYDLQPLRGSLGRMDCIMLHPDGRLEGGSDPRSDNTSIGW